ncbi:hypothetical protein D1007_37343 [Hordeum vulgare]|nr:hypothetical protein D1007_37343 [Hordeum vulgare]
MEEHRRPLPSAADASMESRKRSAASECASQDSPSTSAQPAPHLQLLPQKIGRVDETICDVGHARSGVDGDIEEWVKEDDIDDDVEFIPFPESMVMVESN